MCGTAALIRENIAWILTLNVRLPFLVGNILYGFDKLAR